MCCTRKRFGKHTRLIRVKQRKIMDEKATGQMLWAGRRKEMSDKMTKIFFANCTKYAIFDIGTRYLVSLSTMIVSFEYGILDVGI